MFCKNLLIFLFILHTVCCDWFGDWLQPIQKQLKNRRMHKSRRMFDDDMSKNFQLNPENVEADEVEVAALTTQKSEINKVDLKTKLQETLLNAEQLLEKLQLQIATLEQKEKLLKDAIANGRSGVSTLTVTTTNDQVPRTYMVRDGAWSICNGMVQQPPPNTFGYNAYTMDNDFFAPRCIGQEVKSHQHPCVFNSAIKYETIPEQRQPEYAENEFFCLKPTFNKSLEQYLSVSKTIINNTCNGGIVRSLEDNIQRCGQRIISDYTYYPNRAKASHLYPLEYCAEKDGSCKLIVAWHVSNKTVENFEFLKNDVNFKKLFINSVPEPYIESIL